MLNVVGDHATYHKKYDAPLESDIDAVAGTVSGWVRRSTSPAAVASDAAEAIGFARAQQMISTLILPADVSWSDGAEPAGSVAPVPVPAVADTEPVEEALRDDEATVIMIGGDATRGRVWWPPPGWRRHAAPAFLRDLPTRLERGAGLPPSNGSPTSVRAAAQLAGTRRLILAGAASR